MRAMLCRVSEVGYAATTVADVVAAARVSRNAFYDLFDDKEACYLELCDDATTEMIDDLGALASTGGWIEAVRTGVALYLSWWQRHPRHAAAYLVELPTAGSRALDQRDRAHARFASMHEALAAWARVEQPDLPPLSPLAPRVLVTSTTEIVGQEVRAGHLDTLHTLEDELVFLVVKMLADDETARRARSEVGTTAVPSGP